MEQNIFCRRGEEPYIVLESINMTTDVQQNAPFFITFYDVGSTLAVN